MALDARSTLTKVPAVTLGFWIIKVLATTLGETGGDSVSMSWLGETTAEAGQGGLIGYLVGSLLLLACVLASLFAWYKATGTISVNSIVSPREELFYWVTITFSQTLGTALGDWIADSSLGYSGGALFFGALLAGLAALYYATAISRVLLFWAAFILTRPLG